VSYIDPLWVYPSNYPDAAEDEKGTDREPRLRVSPVNDGRNGHDDVILLRFEMTEEEEEEDEGYEAAPKYFEVRVDRWKNTNVEDLMYCGKEKNPN
jgi:hypothetical protein